MKAFISQPMQGLSDDEIVIVRNQMYSRVFDKHGETCEIIESYFPEDDLTPMQGLAKSLTLMEDADVVYFAPGWDEARGCVIEHAICEFYNIPHVEFEDL